MNIEISRNREAVPRGLVENPVTDPLLKTTKYGRVGCGSDEGTGYWKNRNEDRAVLVDNGFGLFDGMGGNPKRPHRYQHGDRAAQVGAEIYAAGLTQGKSSQEVQMEAYQELQHQELAENGFAYVAARVIEKGKKLYLDVAWAGDVTLFIIRNGKIIPVTNVERSWVGNEDYIDNAVSGEDPGQTRTSPSVELQAGDRIVAFTDGIGDNFTPEQIAEMIRGKSIEEAFKIIADATEAKMKSGQGKPDNRTLLIYDIETLT